MENSVVKYVKLLIKDIRNNFNYHIDSYAEDLKALKEEIDNYDSTF